MKDCAKGYLSDGPVTNADVLRLAELRGFQIDACNADKAAIRAYVKAHPKLSIGK